MLYTVIVLSATLLIALSITLLKGASFLPALAFTVLAVVIVVAIDGIVAAAARTLPEWCADRRKKIFRVSPREKRFYEKIKIRKWKDKIPELGHLTGFRKNKLQDPKSVEYVDRFLLESCYGEIDHFFSALLGFATLAFSFLTPFWKTIAIPVSVITAILNILPLFVLRYNFYKLEILRTRTLKKERLETEMENCLREIATTQA